MQGFVEAIQYLCLCPCLKMYLEGMFKKSSVFISIPEYFHHKLFELMMPILMFDINFKHFYNGKAE